MDVSESHRATAKKSEGEVIGLEGDIEKLRQRLRLLQSEERAEMEEKDEKMKKNRDIIENLQSEINFLRIQLNRGKLGDEKILKKAFQKHSTEIGIMKGKKAQDVVDILEGRVFDLTKKRDILRYEIHKKQDMLETLKNELQDMEKRCEMQNEADPNYIQRAREVENEYQQAQMKILEMQQIERFYQKIFHILNEDILTLPAKLDELENEYYLQQLEIDRLVKREEKAYKARDKAKIELTKAETSALSAKQEKEKVMFEYNQVMEQKDTTSTDTESTTMPTFIQSKFKAEEDALNQMKQEQEKQLEQYRAAFEQIKIATGVTDIEEAEGRFASQKAIRDNLNELKKHSEKLLAELKKEKQDLETQLETFLGSNLVTTDRILKEELAMWQKLYGEQEQRKEAAELEYDKTSTIIADAKSSLWQILQMMEYHLLEDRHYTSKSNPDMSLIDLAEKVKLTLGKITSRLEGKDMDKILQKMKEEQPFLKKLEEERMGAVMPPKTMKPQVEEGSSSEDEEVRKRGEQKKDSQNFADIKQKQKGRGRGMAL